MPTQEKRPEVPPPIVRRNYRPPRLIVYGHVRDLTQGYGIGMPDNGQSQSHSKYKS